MELRDKLNTLTLSGLINLGKKEYGLQHLNNDIKRTSIIVQIIEADRRIKEAAGKGSVKRKVNYSRDGISFKSKEDLDEYLLNIAKETGTLSAAEKESFTSNERRKLAKLKIAQKEIRIFIKESFWSSAKNKTSKEQILVAEKYTGPTM